MYSTTLPRSQAHAYPRHSHSHSNSRHPTWQRSFRRSRSQDHLASIRAASCDRQRRSSQLSISASHLLPQFVGQHNCFALKICSQGSYPRHTPADPTVSFQVGMHYARWSPAQLIDDGHNKHATYPLAKKHDHPADCGAK